MARQSEEEIAQEAQLLEARLAEAYAFEAEIALREPCTEEELMNSEEQTLWYFDRYVAGDR